jgi:putative ABC transport system permease protein
VGIPLAIAVGQLLRTLLFGVPATDPLTHGAVSLALLLAVTLAAWFPARRALRDSPLAAIRQGS